MRRLCSATAAIVCACSPAASAMEFTVTPTAGPTPIINGVGPIVPGDTERLRSVVDALQARQSNGYSLLLASPGGDVVEAVRMADLIRAARASTFVAPNSACESACASILYVAGRFHGVMANGLLGFHGCYRATTIAPDESCTRNIALLSADSGDTAAAVAIAALTFNVPPDRLVYLDAAGAACWGLERLPRAGATAEAEPPCLAKFLDDAFGTN